MKRADEVREWPCLLCGNSMRSEMDHGVVSSFDGCGPAIKNGMDFYTSGNYGSTVADMGPSVTVIICDECLRKHGDRVMVFDQSFHGPHPDGFAKASDLVYTLTEFERRGE